MNVQLVEAFLAVVESQSITQAAKELYLTQSTVSARIKKLEDELGSALIERKKGSRFLELTASGKAFLQLAQRYRQLDREIASFQCNAVRHSLTIACPDSLSTILFQSLYQHLVASSLRFRLTIRTQQSPEIYSLIDRHEADVGFVFHQSRYSSILTEPAVKEKMVLLVSRNGDWPDRPIHPTELDKQFEVYLRWSDEIVLWHDFWWSLGEDPYVQLDTVALLSGFFEDGRCWALCPVSVALSLQNNHNISVRTCAEAIPDRTCYMLTRNNRAEKDEIRIFRETFFHYIRDWNLSEWPIVSKTSR